jgi:Uma2 family endonuclease
MGTFVDTHPALGVCGISEAGFQLSANPDTVRAPDVWFIAAERIPPESIPDGFWPGAPDLAVEALSPSDRFADVLRKVKEYLAAGSQLVWVVDPKGRSAAAFGPGSPLAELLGEDGVLDGGDVLPGFSLTLRDVLP